MNSRSNLARFALGSLTLTAVMVLAIPAWGSATTTTKPTNMHASGTTKQKAKCSAACLKLAKSVPGVKCAAAVPRTTTTTAPPTANVSQLMGPLTRP